jgi:hypothetical protein
MCNTWRQTLTIGGTVHDELASLAADAKGDA